MKQIQKKPTSYPLLFFLAENLIQQNEAYLFNRTILNNIWDVLTSKLNELIS